MKTLIDFLTLRPMWTRRGIEVVWLIYLLATLIQLGFHLQFTYSAIGASVSLGVYMSFAYSTLFLLSHLALVRIILEMAIKFLRLVETDERVSATETPSNHLPLSDESSKK